MRTSEEVARRCLAVELMTQRAALEAQADELGDEVKEMHDGLLTVVSELDLASAFPDAELALLRTPPGALDEDDPALDLSFADIAVLLWCLGRIPRMLTVDDLKGDAMGDVLARGFLAEAEGDIEKIEGLLKVARLRPRDEIEAELTDVAKANALLASSGPGPHTNVPPATVFYVLPWLLSNEWPWGQTCEFGVGEGPLAGMKFTLDGLKN